MGMAVEVLSRQAIHEMRRRLVASDFKQWQRISDPGPRRVDVLVAGVRS